jgi:ribonuclease P protein component
MTLRFIRDEALDPPRVAYAVGSSAGGAVRRNRARRRLRAAIAVRIDTLAPGSYLFGGGPELATCPFELLGARVAELVEAAGGVR